MPIVGDQRFDSLLTSQKNALYRLAQDDGWDTGRFRVDDRAYTNGRGSTVFDYADTDYRFEVYASSGWFSCEFSPGDTTLQLSEGASTTSGLAALFRRWLRNLRRELDSPDLWALAGEGWTALGAGRDAAGDDAPFTTEERASIAEWARWSKRQVLEAGVTGEALARANEKLDYLVEASERMPRLDWRNAALGVIIGMVIETALQSDAAHTLFNAIVNGLPRLLPG